MITFGKKLILTNDVIYIGEGEDPRDNLGFQMCVKALKEIHEEELSKQNRAEDR